MTLSIIVPTLDGSLPAGLPDDPRVEVVAVRGVSPVGRARNEGLRRATGDDLAWADADDALEPGWLAAVLAALDRGADVVVLDYVREGWGRQTPRVWTPSGRGLLADLVGGRLSPEAWRYVIRRDLWKGLYFDETLPVAEDYALLPEVLARATSFARAGLAYRYRVREDSLIHTVDRERTCACFEAARARARRWAGTPLAEDAYAESLRMAGWMDETGGAREVTRAYIRSNWRRAMGCRRLGLWWKFKLTVLALGLGSALKPLYRLFAP